MLTALPQTLVLHSKRHKIKMLKILGSPLSGIFLFVGFRWLREYGEFRDNAISLIPLLPLLPLMPLTPPKNF